MELINIYDAIRAVDRHMLEDGTLDNDISCILEEVTPVMIPQKASSSCSHEKDTISRQAAIDMLKNRWKKTRNYEGIGDDIAEECELYLKQVPSAQPYTDEEIQKMQDIEQAQLDKIRELAYQEGKADAMAEIIRCRDCKHWREDHTCREHSLVSPMMAYEFCSRAERREE